MHRFEFTFTPNHGSWLNLVEGFFSKLARSVLRHIRVSSKQELKDRLMAAVDYFNHDPIPAADDDARSGGRLLVARGPAGGNISHEPLDLPRADLRDPLMTEQRHDVMPKACNRISLLPCFHRFALPNAALHEEALGLI